MRMSCIYGPRQMGTEDQGWVAHFLIRALEGEPISIYGDGRQVRDVLNVADAVEAYVSAWRRIDAVQGRAFNLGGGPANAVSLRQLLRHIEDLIGRPVELSFSDWRAGDQRYYVSDMSRAARALELRSPIPWRTGVAALARWLADERGSRATAIRPAARPGPPRPCREKRGRPGGGGVSVRLIGRRPLRLLMTADAVGGVWQYAPDLAGALADHGVETTLAVLGPAPSAQALAQAVAIPQTAHRHHRPAARLDRRQPGRGCGSRRAPSPRWRAATGADVVHLNSPALAADGAVRGAGRRRLPFLPRDLVARGPLRPAPAGLRLAHGAARVVAFAPPRRSSRRRRPSRG